MEFVDLINERRSARGYESAIDHAALVEILKESQRARHGKTSRLPAAMLSKRRRHWKTCALPLFPLLTSKAQPTQRLL